MKKDNKKNFMFWGLLACGLILSLCGLFCPPLGIIHNSVLLATGEITLLMAGLYNVSIILNFRDKIFCIGTYPEHLKEENKKDETENTSSDSSIIN